MTYNFISKILVSSDGTEIYAEAVGNQSKPHIVFVHGLSLSASVFDRIFHNPTYQDNYYLVRYDTRGHGRSGKPDTIDGYASKLYADDFAVVAKEFQLARPIFVGWSLGGPVAADIAAHLPRDTISGIVYLCGVIDLTVTVQLSTPLSGKTFPVLMDPEVSPEATRVAALSFADGCFELSSVLETGTEEQLKARRLRRWDVQNAWIGYTTHQPIQARTFTTFRQQDPSALYALGAEGFPVLVIHGTQDALLYPERVISKAKELFKNLMVVLIEKGGSHSVFHWNPEEVMEHIGNFANRI